MGEFVQTPLYVRHESPGTAEVLLEVPWQNTRLRGFPSRPGHESNETRQDGHGRLERSELLGCQRRVGGQMTPDEGIPTRQRSSM